MTMKNFYDADQELVDLFEAYFGEEYTALPEENKAALLVDYTNNVREGAIDSREEYVEMIDSHCDDEAQDLLAISTRIRHYQELYL